MNNSSKSQGFAVQCHGCGLNVSLRNSCVQVLAPKGMVLGGAALGRTREWRPRGMGPVPLGRRLRGVPCSFHPAKTRGEGYRHLDTGPLGPQSGEKETAVVDRLLHLRGLPPAAQTHGDGRGLRQLSPLPGAMTNNPFLHTAFCTDDSGHPTSAETPHPEPRRGRAPGRF